MNQSQLIAKHKRKDSSGTMDESVSQSAFDFLEKVDDIVGSNSRF